MKRLILVVLGVLAAWSGPARGKPLDPRAEKIVSQATAALEEKCSSQDCSEFARVAPKLSEAMRIEPNGKTAWVYCKFGAQSRSAGDLPAKLWYEAMLMCDVTLMTHADKEVRNSAGMNAVELREAAYHAGPKDHAPRLSDPAEAARALFGVGFQVKTDGAKVSLSWSAADTSKMQRYIRDYYIPVVLKNSFDSDTLMNAEEKVTLCKEVAHLVRDEARRTEVEQFCEFQAAREANQQVFMFRGPELHPVTHSKLFGIQLLPDGSIIYDPLLSLAGPNPRDEYDSVMAQNKLLEPILARGEKHAFYRDAAKLKLRIDKLIKEKQKAVAKIKEKRLARGPGIYFYDRLGKEWDLPEPVTKHVADCSRLIVEAVNKGYPALTVSVDGEICTSKSWSMLSDECKNALLPGERHKITAELRREKYFKTGKKRAQIHDDSIDIVDEYGSKTGKVLAKAAITCGD
ncbi:MAG TPA: hypothetical protein VK698_04785 [Kofleriaceae bacterium]|nr:hypothetical protein [Kofleriaceae bacterium]